MVGIVFFSFLFASNEVYMRFLRPSFGLFIAALAMSGQSDRGTITGTVSDQAGAFVASAPIQARNMDTAASYEAATSATGNFAISQLPAGNYELTVAIPGFKKYTRQNLTMQVAQVVRVDIALEV